jgi:hypothetical protein
LRGVPRSFADQMQIKTSAKLRLKESRVQVHCCRLRNRMDGLDVPICRGAPSIPRRCR